MGLSAGLQVDAAGVIPHLLTPHFAVTLPPLKSPEMQSLYEYKEKFASPRLGRKYLKFLLQSNFHPISWI